MSKSKTDKTCTCHACQLSTQLLQAMTAQNELMSKIIDQNSVLLDLIASNEADVVDPNRSLDDDSL